MDNDDVEFVPDSWSDIMGIRLLKADAAEVLAEVAITARHLQSFGVVHGGVFAGLIETMASVGARLAARAFGRVVVGVDNHTSFLRAVRSGRLHGHATPLQVGHTTQLWEAAVRDDDGRLAASGRVRLLCREPRGDQRQ